MGYGDANTPNLANCGIQGDVDVSDLVSSQILVLDANSELTSLTGLDKMVEVKWLEIEGTGLSGTLDVSANVKLETLFLGGTGITQVTGLAGNTHFTELYGYGSGLTALNVTGCTSLQFANLSNNYSLASVVGLDDSTAPYVYYEFSSCGQNQAWVDGILRDVDNSGAISGSLNLSGNTAPSEEGLTHVASLTTKGIYVTVDT
jgi:hypothetical protein